MDDEQELRARLDRYRQLLLTMGDDLARQALHDLIEDVETRLDDLEDDDD